MKFKQLFLVFILLLSSAFVSADPVLRWAVTQPSSIATDHIYLTATEACNVVLDYYLVNSNWVQTITVYESGVYANCSASGENPAGSPVGPSNVGKAYAAYVDEPVVCDPPQYKNEANECVMPDQVCFDDVVTGKEICNSIDPSSDENCVMNDNVKMCIADEIEGEENCVFDGNTRLCVGDPNAKCVEIDGVLRCNPKDNVCGVHNGSYQCIAPEAEGCGYFNGKKMCFSPDGKPVPSDSPDHPDNGGNLDGDSTNDITDPRPPSDGGDPDKQPNQPTDTQDSDRASETTAKELLLEQKRTSSILDKIQKNGIETNLSGEVSASEQNSIIQNGATGDWADGATGTWSEVDGYTDGISADDGKGMAVDLMDGIASDATSWVPTGSCSELSFQMAGYSASLGCDETSKIRDLLSWAFYILTLWALFEIVTSPATRQK